MTQFSKTNTTVCLQRKQSNASPGSTNLSVMFSNNYSPDNLLYSIPLSFKKVSISSLVNLLPV